MTTRIDNVRVVSGTSVLADRSVESTGGRITRVGPPHADAAEVIDGTGHTLLPGLVDARSAGTLASATGGSPRRTCRGCRP